jgi:alkylation response protein AidB-like acyl-CoA dehydrogenase
VPAASPGLERRALPTMDQTRRFADVSLRDVRVSAAALIGAEGQGWPVIQRALDLSAIALAAEQVGGAQRCLDLSVSYAKERVQFGRPIGSFQAIKHKCADMMTAVESSRSAAYYACVRRHRGWRRAPQRRVTRQGLVLEAYFRCAADALQIHGGVSFTWEYDVPAPQARARWKPSSARPRGTASAWRRSRGCDRDRPRGQWRSSPGGGRGVGSASASASSKPAPTW